MHPDDRNHWLRCLQIYLPDLFAAKNKKVLDNALKETIAGTLSYNGQRCTALKLLFVPKAYAGVFTKALIEKVEGRLIFEQSLGGASSLRAYQTEHAFAIEFFQQQ